MVPTYGLTHLSLSVEDVAVERSPRFCNRVFGAEDVFREPDAIQAQTPKISVPGLLGGSTDEVGLS